MARSFIRIINELSDVSLPDEKNRLSIEASRALASKQDYAESIVFPIVEALKRSSDLRNFQKISEGEFYELEIRPYYDVDSLMRVSIQVSFLQDFDDLEAHLSEKVAIFLFKELAKKNLDILVNDICINEVQYRNGSLK